MGFSWLSRWLNRHAQPARHRAHRRRAAFPRLEELEPRWVPANYYLVRGTADTQTTLVFQFNQRATNFNDEIGVYTVKDDTGTVANAGGTDVAPNASGYA